MRRVRGSVLHEPTTGEWARAVVVVLLTGAIVLLLLILLAAAFLIQGCGGFPGCVG